VSYMENFRRCCFCCLSRSDDNEVLASSRRPSLYLSFTIRPPNSVARETECELLTSYVARRSEQYAAEKPNPTNARATIPWSFRRPPGRRKVMGANRQQYFPCRSIVEGRGWSSLWRMLSPFPE